MDETIEKYLESRDAAQAALERKVTREFPVGSTVNYKGVRGDASGTVTGHDGEVLVIGDKKVKRHWTKVTKAA